MNFNFTENWRNRFKRYYDSRALWFDRRAAPPRRRLVPERYSRRGIVVYLFGTFLIILVRPIKNGRYLLLNFSFNLHELIQLFNFSIFPNFLTRFLIKVSLWMESVDIENIAIRLIRFNIFARSLGQFGSELLVHGVREIEVLHDIVVELLIFINTFLLNDWDLLLWRQIGLGFWFWEAVFVYLFQLCFITFQNHSAQFGCNWFCWRFRFLLGWSYQ